MLLELIYNKIFLTTLIVLLPIVLRVFLLKKIRQRNFFLSDDQRRWMSYIKNATWTFVLLGLLMVWWPELERFALSIAAVAVAIVLGTRELILCISGSVLRASSGAFTVGDWIEVGNMRGEVIDHSLVSTVIQELDPDNNSYGYTGKTITIPNSIFLSQSVKNMNFMKHYVYHGFSIVVEPEINPFEARELLVNKAREYCEGFREVAQRYNSMLESRMGLDLPGTEPNVTIRTTELARNIISVAIFCPTREAVLIEQNLHQDFMDYFYSKREEKNR